mmetsp:Transcript_45332/g.96415  ORF Transcript_45332/g.96415 Transcript_45332/m.96415 type:complete len:150 (+) Transcript_45332:297-746(+)|eukprot:CAMPEP_0172567680 /NCGR_PEP_ID=MMETSP1067-20121228/116758_1 /TAXON_ID=265564 ORGANISM="Thalassiosira punctigera, Strain Tpunct2005C2" /NCGR_SAMPLE_ID=MMETSP1067 /ASSEMBLY_ACC=CAM_ASM_000444 /LENGTH=149 /DNA_ID=CAMNT_0013359087 /DNA_START=223 /DNA_END=672 /DNA_ORIENTATION=+
MKLLSDILVAFLGNAMTTNETQSASIDGYEYKGKGWCQNAEDLYYLYESLPDAQTLEDCAGECMEKYSLDGDFIGITFFHGHEHSWTFCDCLFSCDDDDGNWSCGHRRGNYKGSGAITGANGDAKWVCYSYDGNDDDLDGVDHVPSDIN